MLIYTHNPITIRLRRYTVRGVTCINGFYGQEIHTLKIKKQRLVEIKRGVETLHRGDHLLITDRELLIYIQVSHIHTYRNTVYIEGSVVDKAGLILAQCQKQLQKTNRHRDWIQRCGDGLFMEVNIKNYLDTFKSIKSSIRQVTVDGYFKVRNNPDTVYSDLVKLPKHHHLPNYLIEQLEIYQEVKPSEN